MKAVELAMARLYRASASNTSLARHGARIIDASPEAEKRQCGLVLVQWSIGQRPQLVSNHLVAGIIRMESVAGDQAQRSRVLRSIRAIECLMDRGNRNTVRLCIRVNVTVDFIKIRLG